MKRSAILLAVFAMLLSGCMYPASELTQNEIPNEMQLEMVQQSVDKYKKNNQGLLPIDTKSDDTPIFQKYVVDFSKLKQAGTLSQIPGNAFENGGIYQYVLIYPEDNTTVKLIDLRIAQQIREVQYKLTAYRNEHLYPPFGKEIAEGVYKLNYKKLGYDSAPYVESPYSENKLPVVMDAKGNLYADYRADLYAELKKEGHDYNHGDDIRYLLTERNPFVPVFSLPYTVKDGEPVFNVN